MKIKQNQRFLLTANVLVHDKQIKSARMCVVGFCSVVLMHDHNNN